jgi:DNA-binding NtrC family response regulator
MAVILCIDDSDVGLFARKLLLERQGHRIITATSAEDGLQCFKAEEVDLVISDHFLSGQTGAEIAAQMKSHSSHVPFILLSGHPEPPEHMPHVDLFIAKGGPVERFLEQVNAILERAQTQGPMTAL